ncbi:MAG: ABC transporter permease, partial [Firmicutes bacterium]|nr:ABC transporter permease [Bacillota bacterium]
MFAGIVQKDISRNKVITATLCLFILLAAMLVSSAANIMIALFGSMDSLFTESVAPHYVQMHSGGIHQAKIDAFSKSNPLVKKQQTVAMLGINGANIYLGGNKDSEAGSIIENSFVTQNTGFDFLLDTKSDVIHVNNGEIAVPIYHMQAYGLQLGDTVRIVKNDFDKEFVITAFVRDVQMNPSIVTSKRFVVSENDWEVLWGNIGEVEYLIEFLLHDVNDVREFERIYQASGLPSKGTAVTYSLFQVLNAITGGVVAAVIVLISLLLIAIAALCLRFTLLAVIEEDYREIGAMKAIGINSRDIRRLYMLKYIAMAGVASLAGYVLSFFVGNLFTANISLYMGAAPRTIWNGIVPALGALLVFLAVVLYCRTVLRRFRKISAVEALRDGAAGHTPHGAKGFRLSRSTFKSVNVYLGAKVVWSQFRMYGILCFIFIVCAFLMIVPFNLLNTLKSPDFVSYMGAGRCDIRIDAFPQQGEDGEARYAQINAYLENDGDIEKHTSLVTAAYKVQNAEGVYESIKVEVGDFSVFPLEYLSGTAPMTQNEIALSSMNAHGLQKGVGDRVTLLVENERRLLTVSGIYQDVTNGGKTAKGLLPYTQDNILWYMVNIDVAGGVSIA